MSVSRMVEGELAGLVGGCRRLYSMNGNGEYVSLSA